VVNLTWGETFLRTTSTKAHVGEEGGNFDADQEGLASRGTTWEKKVLKAFKGC